MIRPIHRFWPALERVVGRSAVTEEWSWLLAASIVKTLSPYPELKARDEPTNQLAEALSRAWRERFDVD